MTWLIVIGAVALLVVALVLVNEVAVYRQVRDARRGLPVLERWSRIRRRDVVVLNWDEPEGRSRLGRLGQ